MEYSNEMILSFCQCHIFTGISFRFNFDHVSLDESFRTSVSSFIQRNITLSRYLNKRTNIHVTRVKMIYIPRDVRRISPMYLRHMR